MDHMTVDSAKGRNYPVSIAGVVDGYGYVEEMNVGIHVLRESQELPIGLHRHGRPDGGESMDDGAQILSMISLRLRVRVCERAWTLAISSSVMSEQRWSPSFLSLRSMAVSMVIPKPWHLICCPKDCA